MRLVGSLPRNASTIASSELSSIARVRGTNVVLSPLGSTNSSVPVWK